MIGRLKSKLQGHRAPPQQLREPAGDSIPNAVVACQLEPTSSSTAERTSPNMKAKVHKFFKTSKQKVAKLLERKNSGSRPPTPPAGRAPGRSTTDSPVGMEPRLTSRALSKLSLARDEDVADEDKKDQIPMFGAVSPHAAINSSDAWGTRRAGQLGASNPLRDGTLHSPRFASSPKLVNLNVEGADQWLSSSGLASVACNDTNAVSDCHQSRQASINQAISRGNNSMLGTCNSPFGKDSKCILTANQAQHLAAPPARVLPMMHTNTSNTELCNQSSVLTQSATYFDTQDLPSCQSSKLMEANQVAFSCVQENPVRMRERNIVSKASQTQCVEPTTSEASSCMVQHISSGITSNPIQTPSSSGGLSPATTPEPCGDQDILNQLAMQQEGACKQNQSFACCQVEGDKRVLTPTSIGAFAIALDRQLCTPHMPADHATSSVFEVDSVACVPNTSVEASHRVPTLCPKVYGKARSPKHCLLTIDDLATSFGPKLDLNNNNGGSLTEQASLQSTMIVGTHAANGPNSTCFTNVPPVETCPVHHASKANSEVPKRRRNSATQAPLTHIAEISTMAPIPRPAWRWSMRGGRDDSHQQQKRPSMLGAANTNAKRSLDPNHLPRPRTAAPGGRREQSGLFLKPLSSLGQLSMPAAKLQRYDDRQTMGGACPNPSSPTPSPPRPHPHNAASPKVEPPFTSSWMLASPNRTTPADLALKAHCPSPTPSGIPLWQLRNIVKPQPHANVAPMSEPVSQHSRSNYSPVPQAPQVVSADVTNATASQTPELKQVSAGFATVATTPMLSNVIEPTTSGASQASKMCPQYTNSIAITPEMASPVLDDDTISSASTSHTVSMWTPMPMGLSHQAAERARVIAASEVTPFAAISSENPLAYCGDDEPAVFATKCTPMAQDIISPCPKSSTTIITPDTKPVADLIEVHEAVSQPPSSASGALKSFTRQPPSPMLTGNSVARPPSTNSKFSTLPYGFMTTPLIHRCPSFPQDASQSGAGPSCASGSRSVLKSELGRLQCKLADMEAMLVMKDHQLSSSEQLMSEVVKSLEMDKEEKMNLKSALAQQQRQVAELIEMCDVIHDENLAVQEELMNTASRSIELEAEVTACHANEAALTHSLHTLQEQCATLQMQVLSEGGEAEKWKRLAMGCYKHLKRLHQELVKGIVYEDDAQLLPTTSISQLSFTNTSQVARRYGTLRSSILRSSMMHASLPALSEDAPPDKSEVQAMVDDLASYVDKLEVNLKAAHMSIIEYEQRLTDLNGDAQQNSYARSDEYPWEMQEDYVRIQMENHDLLQHNQLLEERCNEADHRCEELAFQHQHAMHAMHKEFHATTSRMQERERQLEVELIKATHMQQAMESKWRNAILQFQQQQHHLQLIIANQDDKIVQLTSTLPSTPSNKQPNSAPRTLPTASKRRQRILRKQGTTRVRVLGKRGPAGPDE